MMIYCENAGKVTAEGKFSCAACRNSVGSNSILFLPVFLQVLVLQRYSGIRQTERG